MSRHRKITAENTDFFGKKFVKSLQVKNLRIMFVVQSNKSYESNVNPTIETNFLPFGIFLPVSFHS